MSETAKVSYLDARAFASYMARLTGRRPHRSLYYRWTRRGCRGVVLPSYQIGNTRCTTVADLQWFFEELGRRSSAPDSATSRQASDGTEEALDHALGCDS